MNDNHEVRFIAYGSRARNGHGFAFATREEAARHYFAMEPRAKLCATCTATPIEPGRWWPAGGFIKWHRPFELAARRVDLTYDGR